MNQWYYAVNQERLGPVDDATLAALAANEIVTADTLVWRQGMPDWQPYMNVSDALGTDEQPPPSIHGGTAMPSLSGQSIQLDGRTVTEANKEAYVQQLQEGVDPLGRGWRYGGFWIRVAAFIIDSVFTSILTYAIIIPLAFLMGGTLGSLLDSTGEDSLGIAFFIFFMGVGIVIPAAYYTLTTGSKMQATYGKKLVGLRVIREDGGDITYGLALGRYFGLLLSTLILYIGLIIAAFDDQKRALHDYLCGTRVIER